MDLGLVNKTALVTGASRGLGLACALALAAEGALRRHPQRRLTGTARTGLWAWAKTAAADLAPEGITLNLACPGGHDTDRNRQLGGTGH